LANNPMMPPGSNRPGGFLLEILMHSAPEASALKPVDADFNLQSQRLAEVYRKSIKRIQWQALSERSH
ncbi:MAG: hypothetical protein AAGL08_02990, partial [Cyanobacteria bacterium J06573_11]